MIKFNETYNINNGQESIVFKKGNGNTITGVYNDGTLTGTMEGNLLKATFHNKKSNGAGLIEFTFNAKGFDCKWKQGLEPGPMRGKWTGELPTQSSKIRYASWDEFQNMLTAKKYPANLIKSLEGVKNWCENTFGSKAEVNYTPNFMTLGCTNPSGRPKTFCFVRMRTNDIRFEFNGYVKQIQTSSEFVDDTKSAIITYFNKISKDKILRSKQISSIEVLLDEPGDCTLIDPVDSTVMLTWSTREDFDLSILYMESSGKTGSVYFANKGSLNSYPFMQLDKDAMSGYRNKMETIRISKINMSKLAIIAWDYSNQGRMAAFNTSDVKITIKDKKGFMSVAKLRVTEPSDSVCVASIENTSDGFVFTNESVNFMRKTDSQNWISIFGTEDQE